MEKKIRSYTSNEIKLYKTVALKTMLTKLTDNIEMNENAGGRM